MKTPTPTARVLNDDETHRWTKLTRSYLRMRGVAVERMTVANQELSASILDEDSEPVIVGTSSSPSSSSTSTDRGNSRKLQKHDALLIRASVQGRNVRRVAKLLQREWEDYRTFLESGMYSKPSSALGARNMDVVSWTLLGVALGMSLLAMTAVVAARSSGRRRLQSHSRRQRNVGRSVENNPSPSRHRSRRNLHDQDDIGNAAASSSVVSIESESGWNTFRSAFPSLTTENPIQGNLVYV